MVPPWTQGSGLSWSCPGSRPVPQLLAYAPVGPGSAPLGVMSGQCELNTQGTYYGTVSSFAEEVRRYWDEDSLYYDDVSHHHPVRPAEQAAWQAALAEVLPPEPSRVLDCGAGTGFVSLMAARLGHMVTAVDISSAMLERLKAKAGEQSLNIEVLEGTAEDPPDGPFDAVVERHLLWTLPDPLKALRAWRNVAPFGRLVLVESIWGEVDPLEALRGRARSLLAHLRCAKPEHHAPYPGSLRGQLPLASGTSPDVLAGLVSSAGWVSPQLKRLRDVEWASSLGLRWPERLIGVSPRFILHANSAPSHS